MSPVKQLALKHGLEVYQPPTLCDASTLSLLRSAAPEVMVVAAYGLILPQSVLDVARAGALNIHASLLPRWRGAAPIQRAILAGDTETGITIMQMDAGLDTGAMLAQSKTPISENDSALSLHDKLASLGAQLIVRVLSEYENGDLIGTPQPAVGVTYAGKIAKGEACLDWRKSSLELDRRVRAFNPFPGAHTTIDDAKVKVWHAYPIEGRGEPGEVLSSTDNGIVVACGDGALILLELQRAGARRLGVRDFLRGHPLQRGARFMSPG